MSGLKVTIDQTKHAVTILDKLYKMKCDRELCDFFIMVGSEEIFAHRHVMCASSEYFDNYFETEEAKSNVLELHDEDFKCVNCCIDFMYGRKLALSNSRMEGAMRLAKLWKLNKLSDAIVALYENNLTLDGFFAAKAVAALSDSRTLEKKCGIFGRLHFAAIAKLDEFVILDKDFIKQMMKFKHVKISEEEKLNAIIKWIKHDPHRSLYLMEMIKLVDLKKVPLVYRHQLMEDEPIVNTSEECSLHFSISFLDAMDITLLGRQAEEMASQGSEIVLFVGESWCLHQYNPKSGTLIKKHDLSEDMHMGFTVITLNQHLYLLCENKSVYRIKYNDQDAVWEQMANMHVKHGMIPWSVLVFDHIYVIGGDIGGATDVVEVYDPELDKWQCSTSRPVSSIGAGVVAYQERIYCFGGMLEGKTSDKVAIFDTLSTSWTDTTPMKDAKTHVSPVEFDGKIYIVGGCIANKNSRSVDCYDISSKTWTTVRRLKRPRFKPSVVVFDRCIYAFGGAKAKNTYEKYDPGKNEWSIEELSDGDLCVREAVTFDFTS